jgi:hypothetical protein
MELGVAKSFPWGAWLVLDALAIGTSVLCYLLWNRRGPERWYRKGPSIARNTVWTQSGSGLLPASIAFVSLSCAAVLQYASLKTGGSVHLAWAFVALTGLAGVAIVLIFFLSVPQRLIPPPFRKGGEFDR